MDEATSSLDAAVEQRIQESMAKAMGGAQPGDRSRL
jgi:ABC-type multidrug transport system fused ATPase/permease subunit